MTGSSALAHYLDALPYVFATAFNPLSVYNASALQEGSVKYASGMKIWQISTSLELHNLLKVI